MVENPADNQGLQNYLADIANIDPLSREEEKILLIKAQKGDKKAMKKLIRSNLKFVVKIASKFQNRGLPLSELISEGNLGLIKAINKFDTTRETKLITYAVWWIRQTIQYALYEKNRLIRIPSKRITTINKISKIQKNHKAKKGENASLEEIAEQLGIDEERTEKILNERARVISLDSIYGDNDALDRLDVSSKDTQSFYSQNIDPKRIYYRKKLQDKINHKMETLSPRDARIIKDFFGFGDTDKGKNFAEIAREIGLSRERVRQIFKQIIEEMREETVDEVDIDYLLDL